MKDKYIVTTHLGDYPTMAATPGRAKANVQFKIFGRSPAAKRYTQGWTVRKAS